MNRIIKVVSVLFFANSLLLGLATSQDTNSINNGLDQLKENSVRNSTLTDNANNIAEDNRTRDSIYPGEYPGTSGGEVEITQGLIDTLINRIKGKDQVEVNITSVGYSYRSDGSPTIDLYLNITGLSGREDFKPSSFFKSSSIWDPSGNQCQAEFKQLGDARVINSEVERTEEWLKTGMKCQFDEEVDLKDGVYDLDLVTSFGEAYTANFNISGYRTVEFPVKEKNVTTYHVRKGAPNSAAEYLAKLSSGSLGKDFQKFYNIKAILDHENGLKRFSMIEEDLEVRGPEGEAYPVVHEPGSKSEEPISGSYTTQELAAKELERESQEKKYDLGIKQNSTVEFKIPAKNYTKGRYIGKFKSNTTNKTYGRTSFELVKEEPKLEFSNPEIKFKEDPWTVEETSMGSMKEQRNMPDDTRFLELYVKHLELDVDNLGDLKGSITDFKYKREGMDSFESWRTKGKNPNKVELKIPRDIPAMGQETVKLPFGQSMVRWDEYNGPMTILIETGTGNMFKITGELSEPVYKCQKRTMFLFSLPDCELQEDAEFSNTEITKIN